jgi:hypothetical protein
MPATAPLLEPTKNADKVRFGGGYDKFMIDFDPAAFLAAHKIRREDAADKLGYSHATIRWWQTRGHMPLTAYKALVITYAPQDAMRYERKLTVSRATKRVPLTKEVVQIAAAYDDARVAEGGAFNLDDYKTSIPVADTRPLPPEQVTLPLKPKVTEKAEKEAADIKEVADIIQSMETAIQALPPHGGLRPVPAQSPGPDDFTPGMFDALATLLLRLQADRNSMAARLAIAEQRVRDAEAARQAMVAERTQLDLELARLREDVRTWEQLAETSAASGNSLNTVPDTDVTAVSRAFKNRGLPSLADELESLPKHPGHRNS